MAEEENTEQPEEKKSGGGMMSLVLNILVAGSAIAAGFATPYLIASTPEKDPEEEVAKKEIPLDDDQLDYLEFGEVTSNLDEPNMTRYLRVKISVQINKEDKEEITKLMETKKMVLQDWLNAFLSSQNMDSVRGRAGQNRLRREIKDYFNSVLFLDGLERIHGILFLDFSVQ